MPSKPMIDRAKRGAFDDLSTPREALSPLLPYIQHWKNKLIWECAPGSLRLVELLLKEGFKVVCNDNHDFLNDDPTWPYEWMLTNPPFSKKAKWLKRANDLGKPWAFLLPVTTLGVRACQKELDGAQVVYLPRRIDFTGKKAPWFAVAWFTKGLNLPGGQIILP